MADERIEDISGGQLSVVAPDDLLVVLDASDTTDDADGTTKWAYARTLAGLYRGALIDGLTLSNNGTDAAHDIDVATGVCTVTDGTNWSIAELSTAITKQIDASWASGTDAGGLDGTESVAGTPDASTWYHVFIILNPTTNAVDALFSESATTPTLPSGYTYYRRIGAVYTDGSANVTAFSQVGDEFIWDATPVVEATNPGTSAVLVTLQVPSGVNVDAILDVTLYGANSTNFAALYSSPLKSDEAVGVGKAQAQYYTYMGFTRNYMAIG